MIDIRLLGEPELWAGDRQVPLGPPRQRAVFAALVAEPGRRVPIDVLIDRVWGGEPRGKDLRATVYPHVSRIRQALTDAAAADGGAPVRLESTAAGYRCVVDPERVDLFRFRGLVALPGHADADRLEAALALWRGPALDGVPGDWAEQRRAAWREEWLQALLDWADVLLRDGRPAAVTKALTEAAAEFPLHERLAALHLRALHATGRGAEALDRFAAIRRRLEEELGADPGEDLQAVHRTLLGEPSSAARARPVAHPATRPAVPPAQLPAGPAGFSGRTALLTRLDAILSDPAPGAPIVVTLSGTAGVGKTSLALHWAHRLRAQFPDGQLFADLRGFDPHNAPVDPDVVTRGFLDAFGVTPERVPAGPDARTALLRSLLSDRRMLLVLDNAWSAAQVRPLLPGTAGCVTVVTSRNQLLGLVTDNGAVPVGVDLLDWAESEAVLAARLGSARLAAEPEVVAEIVEACARLPLALAIVAARAAASPGLSLAAVSGQLRRSLDEFAGDDERTDARAVFSWSYRRLNPPAARLFRLMGGQPGPDLARATVAALDPEAVPRSLHELVRANLVAEAPAGRFRLHDLLRAYAIELSEREDTEAARRAATRQLRAHYVDTAEAADVVLKPHRARPSPPPPPGALPDRAEALAWFAAEHATLLAALEHATADEDADDRFRIALSWPWHTYLDHRGLWLDGLRVQRSARDAARRLGDLAAEARSLISLATLEIRLKHPDRAATVLHEALRLSTELADPAAQADAHRGLAWCEGLHGRHGNALEHDREALRLYREAGDQVGEARARNAVGWCHAQLGEFLPALEHCTAALALHRAAGNRNSEAAALDSLGYVNLHLDRLPEAVRHYEAAVTIYRELDHRYYEADTLSHLGDAHLTANDKPAARAAWQAALAILDDLGHADAAELRARAALI